MDRPTWHCHWRLHCALAGRFARRALGLFFLKLVCPKLTHSTPANVEPGRALPLSFSACMQQLLQPYYTTFFSDPSRPFRDLHVVRTSSASHLHGISRATPHGGKENASYYDEGLAAIPTGFGPFTLTRSIFRDLPSSKPSVVAW